MKTIAVACIIVVVLGLAPWTPAQAAMLKCTQADGSVMSVPESVGCGIGAPTPKAASLKDRMAEACDVLYGPGSHTPIEGSNKVETAVLEYRRSLAQQAQVEKLGVNPSWGQCDELQRMQIRERMR